MEGTQMEMFNFLWLIWDHYLPLTPTKGLILCSKKKILWVDSRDFSQADKEITACKAEQTHKMTISFTQNDNLGLLWVKIVVIL